MGVSTEISVKFINSKLTGGMVEKYFAVSPVRVNTIFCTYPTRFVLIDPLAVNYTNTLLMGSKLFSSKFI